MHSLYLVLEVVHFSFRCTWQIYVYTLACMFCLRFIPALCLKFNAWWRHTIQKTKTTITNYTSTCAFFCSLNPHINVCATVIMFACIGHMEQQVMVSPLGNCIDTYSYIIPVMKKNSSYIWGSFHDSWMYYRPPCNRGSSFQLKNYNK